MTDIIDHVVIGGGVIGLSLARALAKRGAGVLLLERHDRIGSETSSRNSEVIHAGMYYAQDTLKARLCVAGRQSLYAYCDENGIAYRKTGKLIVAAHESQRAALQSVYDNGLKNGVADLHLLTGNEARAMEPALTCVAAIHSPSTGILNTHEFMFALQSEAEQHGAQCVFHAAVEGVDVIAEGFAVHAAGTTVVCRHLFNAAGLEAVALAEKIENFPQAALPQLRLAKGNYFTHTPQVPFSRLIYPMPEPGGLGIHLALVLAGLARFGPDVEWIDTIDYTVDTARSAYFYEHIRRYWPGLQDGALSPGYAGIRPKVQLEDQIFTDFIISGPAQHGIPNLVNMFGIESPGLTASLALAAHALAQVHV